MVASGCDLAPPWWRKCLYTVRGFYTLVHPREVYADALTDRAAALVVAHNHPSGKVDPSPEDREVTSRLMAAGETLGIRLLDHVIFSLEGYYSFLEHGEV